MSEFSERLRAEQDKYSQKNKKEAEKSRKVQKTPVLPKTYADTIARYRTVPYMSKPANMNVFR